MPADPRDDGPTRWYTVREAAAYLAVSQPTIFRWMKEGLLSYYKVGGSTRFSREDLDAVVEKNTSRREAQAVRTRCAACGHHELVMGRLQGTGRTYFVPQTTRFWVFTDSYVNLKAAVCTACGFVQIHADTSKLRRLRPETVTSEVPAPDEEDDEQDTGTPSAAQERQTLDQAP